MICEAAAELAKNAQTVLTENPSQIMHSSVSSRGEGKSKAKNHPCVPQGIGVKKELQFAVTGLTMNS